MADKEATDSQDFGQCFVPQHCMGFFASVRDAGGPPPDMINVSGLLCDGCGKPHVIMSSQSEESGMRIVTAFGPAMAREIGAQLFAIANKFDPKGSQ